MMRQFIKSTPALKPKTKESGQVAYLYSFILIVLVLCQLFTFDKFTLLLESFALPGSLVTEHLVASLIVVSEVFALPFLLGLKISSLMRVVSMVFGGVAPLIWFVLSLWLIFATNSAHNFGLLGTVVTLVPGWWAMYVSVALIMLAAWASWGLWPIKRKHTK